MISWGGHEYQVRYIAPEPKPGSHGTVYLLDDGLGIKVGHTTNYVAHRIGQLQTGNPRKIYSVAEISDAGTDVEAWLHDKLDKGNLTRREGEWFDREEIVEAKNRAGGVEQWLRGLLQERPERAWTIGTFRGW